MLGGCAEARPAQKSLAWGLEHGCELSQVPYPDQPNCTKARILADRVINLRLTSRVCMQLAPEDPSGISHHRALAPTVVGAKLVHSLKMQAGNVKVEDTSRPGLKNQYHVWEMCKNAGPASLCA